MWKPESRSESEHKLKTAFAKFDRNGDGKIQKAEFEQLMKSLGEPLLAKEIDSLFSLLDSDEHGNIQLKGNRD